MGALWSALFGDRYEERHLLKEILQNNCAFTVATYNAIRAEHEGDIFFSAPHLQMALMSLFAGATAAGADAIRAAFRVPEDRSLWQRAHAALRRYLHNMKNTTVASAVRVITPDHVRLIKDYYVSSHKYFSVDIKPTNLTRPHQELRTGINNWISKRTKGFITQLVPDGSVNTTIQMLMISAVYFKANLEFPFYATDSTNELFYVTGDPDEVRAVKIMHQTNMYCYGEFENLQCQAVELPFKSPNLSCLLLLPFAGDGLAALEKNLSSINFRALLENMKKAKVKVSIPSFRLQEKYDMCDYLDGMGLASLSNYHESPLKKVSQCEPPMSITQFNHEFYFELSEETVDPFERVMEPEDQSNTFAFRADHPFLFIIFDKWLDMILAFGRINCHSRFTTPIFHQMVLDQRDQQLRQYLEEQTALEETQQDDVTHFLSGENYRTGVRFHVETEQITHPRDSELIT